MSASRPVRSQDSQRSASAERSVATSSEDSATNSAASVSPTGVAKSKPLLRASSRIPGVAAACSPRNPAAATNAIDTTNSRASVRRRAASLITTARMTLIQATTSTSQKWAGWCCHTMSIRGWVISNHSPNTGSARWNTHTARRVELPR